MIFCVYDCLRRRMGGHTPTSDTLPRESPPPHSLQQLTNLLWCVERLSWQNQTWAPYSSAESGKVPKSGKNITYETTPDHYFEGLPIGYLMARFHNITTNI